MIEVFGPTYRYQGEQLTEPEIIVVNDHQYSEQDQCYHVEQLLSNSVCDPKDHVLVMISSVMKINCNNTNVFACLFSWQKVAKNSNNKISNITGPTKHMLSIS